MFFYKLKLLELINVLGKKNGHSSCGTSAQVLNHSKALERWLRMLEQSSKIY